MIAAPIAEGAVAMIPQRSRFDPLFSWFLHFQNMVLLAYVSWALFDPTNTELLVGVFLLPALWLTALVLGGWCWWCARDTSTLLLALWGVSAAPLMVAIQVGLLQSKLFPLADADSARLVLATGLFVYPLAVFGKFLLRLTKPGAQATERAGASLIARFIQVSVTLLMLLAFLLAIDLLADEGWFGQGTFEPWFYAGASISFVAALVAGPFALLSLVRRNQPLGLSLWILAALLITAGCYFAIFFFIAVNSAG